MNADILAERLAAPLFSDERSIVLDDGQPALIRALRPEDDALYEEFGRHVTSEDHRRRFFAAAGGLSPERAWALTHYDPREARAYLAVDPTSGEMLGVGRIHRTKPDEGEFAVLVRSDLKGHGLGRELMHSVLEGAGDLDVRTVWGLVLCENRHMLALCRELGFAVAPFSGEPGIVEVRRVSD